MSALREILELQMAETSDVYVGQGVDPSTYFEELRDDIRKHECQPFKVTASVMAPGFPGLLGGEKISGMCVAKDAGRWLVYQEKDKLFYAFWGTNEDSLGAHGISGSPLYCWSA